MSTTTTGTTRLRAAALLGLALVLPAGLAACGQGPGRAQTGSDVPAASSGSETAGGEQDGEQAGGGEGSAPSGGASAGAEGRVDQVLGTSAAVLKSEPGDGGVDVPLSMAVTSVERIDGDAVEVRWTLTNDGDLDFEDFGAFEEVGETTAAVTVGNARLIDLPGDRVYLTLRDEKDGCQCTMQALSDAVLSPGETWQMFARFPAPPESTSTIEFSLRPFPSVGDLEIS